MYKFNWICYTRIFVGDGSCITWGNLVGTFKSSYSWWWFFPQLIHSFVAAITFLGFVYFVETRLVNSIPGYLFYLVKEARAWDWVCAFGRRTSLSMYVKALQSDNVYGMPHCRCCGSLAAPVRFQFFLSSRCSSCYCFKARCVGSVSSFVLSKGIEPLVCSCYLTPSLS